MSLERLLKQRTELEQKIAVEQKLLKKIAEARAAIPVGMNFNFSYTSIEDKPPGTGERELISYFRGQINEINQKIGELISQ